MPPSAIPMLMFLLQLCMRGSLCTKHWNHRCNEELWSFFWRCVCSYELEAARRNEHRADLYAQLRLARATLASNFDMVLLAHSSSQQKLVNAAQVQRDQGMSHHTYSDGTEGAMCSWACAGGNKQIVDKERGALEGKTSDSPSAEGGWCIAEQAALCLTVAWVQYSAAAHASTEQPQPVATALFTLVLPDSAIPCLGPELYSRTQCRHDKKAYLVAPFLLGIR